MTLPETDFTLTSTYLVSAAPPPWFCTIPEVVPTYNKHPSAELILEEPLFDS